MRIKNLFISFFALKKGFKYCFFDPEIRRLSIWPWVVGAACYLVSMFSAYKSHNYVLNLILDSPDSWWQIALYYLAGFILAILLLIFTLVVTITITMILTAVFQTSIAEKVLEKKKIQFPESESSVKGIAKETGRTILTESVKLLWLAPTMLLALILGFIPILTPLALVLGAWLLSFQFIDIVLDIYRIPALKRLKFSLKNWVVVAIFGLSLTIAWAIPLLGFLLPPIAVAAATDMLVELGLLENSDI